MTVSYNDFFVDCIIMFCSPTDAMLRFVDGQQTSYSENESVTVCAMLSLATERTVVATITAQDGSAMRKLSK